MNKFEHVSGVEGPCTEGDTAGSKEGSMCGEVQCVLGNGVMVTLGPRNIAFPKVVKICQIRLFKKHFLSRFTRILLETSLVVKWGNVLVRRQLPLTDATEVFHNKLNLMTKNCSQMESKYLFS